MSLESDRMQLAAERRANLPTIEIPIPQQHGGSWSRAEDRIIRENYGKFGVARTVAMLPHRTKSTIQQQAFRLGLKAARIDLPLHHSKFERMETAAPDPADEPERQPVIPLDVKYDHLFQKPKPQATFAEIQKRNHTGNFTPLTYKQQLAHDRLAQIEAERAAYGTRP